MTSTKRSLSRAGSSLTYHYRRYPHVTKTRHHQQNHPRPTSSTKGSHHHHHNHPLRHRRNHDQHQHQHQHQHRHHHQQHHVSHHPRPNPLHRGQARGSLVNPGSFPAQVAHVLLDRLQLSNTTASVDKLGPSALKLIGLGVQLASPWRQAAVMAAPSDLTLKWFDIAVGSFHKRQHTKPTEPQSQRP